VEVFGFLVTIAGVVAYEKVAGCERNRKRGVSQLPLLPCDVESAPDEVESIAGGEYRPTVF
jgi:hypothetical protein